MTDRQVEGELEEVMTFRHLDEITHFNTPDSLRVHMTLASTYKK
jgi:hypothetical protein